MVIVIGVGWNVTPGKTAAATVVDEDVGFGSLLTPPGPPMLAPLVGICVGGNVASSGGSVYINELGVTLCTGLILYVAVSVGCKVTGCRLTSVMVN